MTTYNKTIEWLFNQLPMYQRVGGSNYKIDLEKTHQLMRLLQYPENKFKSIHVAGTNGKGSTSHMLASIFQEAGYKTGLYTSPHLVDFRERVKINGECISEEKVIEFVNTYKKDFEKLQLSFFEMTVGLAFWYFADNVDIAIIEVGMGGRLDSTNVVTPEVSIITNIGNDHKAFLGDTLPEIAGEKAGIIKENVPVVIGEYHPETFPVFTAEAKRKNAPLTLAEKSPHRLMPSDLKGLYQVKNQRTVLNALDCVNGFSISQDNIANGLLKVIKNTGLHGRWEQIQENPKVVLDTAHNHEGLSEIAKQLANEKYRKLHIVWGMVSDKDAGEIMKLMPQSANWYLSEPSIPRKMALADLEEIARSLKLSYTSHENVKAALMAARKHASQDDFIYVGGSTFVVADVLA